MTAELEDQPAPAINRLDPHTKTSDYLRGEIARLEATALNGKPPEIQLAGIAVIIDPAGNVSLTTCRVGPAHAVKMLASAISVMAEHLDAVPQGVPQTPPH